MILLIGTLFSTYVPQKVFANLDSYITLGTTDSIETCLDPARAYDYFSLEIIRNLGSGLVAYRPGATGRFDDYIPALATSWFVSSDSREWTFSLRQGVTYEDGKEFNATHVKYTFDRAIGMADPQGPFVGIGFNDIIQNVTVVDKYTAKFILKTPFGAFLSLIASPECVMVDPKYAPMHGTSWDYATDVILYTEGNARASYPLGLGPYFLENWTRIAGQTPSSYLQPIRATGTLVQAFQRVRKS